MGRWTQRRRDAATLEERRLKGLTLLRSGLSQAEVARRLGLLQWRCAIGRTPSIEGGQRPSTPSLNRADLRGCRERIKLPSPRFSPKERWPTGSQPTSGRSRALSRSPRPGGAYDTPRLQCGECSSATGSRGRGLVSRPGRRTCGPSTIGGAALGLAIKKSPTL
jgi:hypothetical protein